MKKILIFPIVTMVIVLTFFVGLSVTNAQEQKPALVNSEEFNDLDRSKLVYLEKDDPEAKIPRELMLELKSFN